MNGMIKHLIAHQLRRKNIKFNFHKMNRCHYLLVSVVVIPLFRNVKEEMVIPLLNIEKNLFFFFAHKTIQVDEMTDQFRK